MAVRELADPKGYFPYIGHELDHAKQLKVYIYNLIIGNLFDRQYVHILNEDQILLDSRTAHLFNRVEINGVEPLIRLAKDPSSAVLIVPRHRTLYDYTIGQPVHHNLINPEVMLLAGNNLFVSQYDRILRTFGAMMFLREDTWLTHKGLPRGYLTQERYINEIFPAYLRTQMVDGCSKANERIRRDLIIYPEQEKHPVTNIREGGRSKTGKLRNLSPILFDKLKNLTKDTDVKLYVVPANVSLSKIPDVPFIVNSTTLKGLNKKIRYFTEQYFVYYSYPRHAIKYPEAKLDVILNYGKPELLSAADFQSMKDLIKYSKDLKDKIGMLESLFPVQFLYRAMDEDSEIPLQTLEERTARLYEHYLKLNINVEKISAAPGKLMSAGELVERSLITINSNPHFHIKHVSRDKFLSLERGRLVSHDAKVQAWYANNLRHLDG